MSAQSAVELQGTFNAPDCVANDEFSLLAMVSVGWWSAWQLAKANAAINRIVRLRHICIILTQQN